jgi:hypothetical protein
MQKEVEEHDGLVPMILLTHRVVEQRMNDAIAGAGSAGRMWSVRLYAFASSI